MKLFFKTLFLIITIGLYAEYIVSRDTDYFLLVPSTVLVVLITFVTFKEEFDKFKKL